MKLNGKISLIVLAWLPLLVLSMLEGNAAPSSHLKLSFLQDIETHLRLLVALPILVFGDSIGLRGLRIVIGQFRAREIIQKESHATFETAVFKAFELCTSKSIKAILLFVVYTAGFLVFWKTHIALEFASWYGTPMGESLIRTYAGWWLTYISLPISQFMILLWYVRGFIWARLLWQISRMKIQILPAHPDSTGGIAFLAGGTIAFFPLVFAQGLLLSGLIANRIFFHETSIMEFNVEIAGLVGLMTLLVIGPLHLFTPNLLAARSKGLAEFGGLAERYVREFEMKWFRSGNASRLEILGSGDIQSLADMNGSYGVVRGMRIVPYRTQTVLQLVLITLLPILPLLLTMIPLNELVKRIIKLIL